MQYRDWLEFFPSYDLSEEHVHHFNNGLEEAGLWIVPDDLCAQAG